MTRLRALPPTQAACQPAPSGNFPQRGAVLSALRGLTGKDGGASSARWRELLSPITAKRKGEQERPGLAKIPVSLADSPGRR